MTNDHIRHITNRTLALIKLLESSQWTHAIDLDLIQGMPILTRERLNKIDMQPGLFSASTSGSTGEPVTVQKTLDDQVWLLATNIREYQWRKWDYTKTLAIIKPGRSKMSSDNWGLPKRLAPVQGPSHIIGYESINNLQKWVEAINPHYLSCAPSIRDALDIAKITNLIDWKGTGERGGTMYSSEECGTIAIQCPDVPGNYHVMENQLVEVNRDGQMIITTLSNPYIKRYQHGDHIQLGTCTCGRSLQTITNIQGRIRNMFIMPDGDKKWPLFGSRTYFQKYGIKRFKLIQISITAVKLQYIADYIRNEPQLIQEIKELLADINVILEPVDSFPDYKFEEFVSLVDNGLLR